MGIANLFGLCGVAIDNLGGAHSPVPDLVGAKSNLTESFKTLWFRESALRLTIDTAEAEQAENLMKLAARAVGHVDELVEAIFTHGNVGPPESRLTTSMAELHAGIVEWASQARRNLEPDGQGA